MSKEKRPAMEDYYHDVETSKKILKHTADEIPVPDYELPIQNIEFETVWSTRKDPMPEIVLKETPQQYRRRKNREYYQNHKNDVEYVNKRSTYNKEYQKINKDKINARRRKNRKEKLK